MGARMCQGARITSRLLLPKCFNDFQPQLRLACIEAYNNEEADEPCDACSCNSYQCHPGRTCTFADINFCQDHVLCYSVIQIIWLAVHVCPLFARVLRGCGLDAPISCQNFLSGNLPTHGLDTFQTLDEFLDSDGEWRPMSKKRLVDGPGSLHAIRSCLFVMPLGCCRQTLNIACWN